MNFKNIQKLIKLANELELHELDIEKKDFKIHIRTQYEEPEGEKKVQVEHPTMAMMPPQQAPAPAPQQHAANQQPAQQQPQQGKQAATQQEEETQQDENTKEIKSPMIGTFYRKPNPDKDPYVKVGDKVEKGDTLCIIEAMKLFNEIEAEESGKIVKILAEDASPVEYDQPLFLLEPDE